MAASIAFDITGKPVGEVCATDSTWRNENFIPGGMIKSVEVIQQQAEEI